MAKKPEAPTEHPLRKQKLNRDRRLKLARYAAERFRCPDLREIEAAAHAKLTHILNRDANSVPKVEIAVLEKHGFVHEVKGFRLPHDIHFLEDNPRSFKLPDGTPVNRDSGKTLSLRRPEKDEYELPNFYSWDAALKTTSERGSAIDYRDENSRVALKRRTKMPGRGDRGYGEEWAYMSENTARDAQFPLKFDSINSGFLSADVKPALVQYYKAADKRILEERRLICAAIKVIANCDTYGQVLDFWAEAADIEDTLFNAVLPSALSLVVLSEEDKSALCRNMSQRGVQSVACQRGDL